MQTLKKNKPKQKNSVARGALPLHESNCASVTDYKFIPLTQNQFAIVDSNDFEELSKHKWQAAKRKNSFYAVRNTGKLSDRTKERMHRRIMNAQKSQEIDHVNSNGLDNRRCNLRDCTRSQNNQNRRKAKGTSQYKGVSWCKNGKKWRAEIGLNYKSHYLGYFDSEIEAAKAYDAKALELFGEFAWLNFPVAVGRNDSCLHLLKEQENG